MSDKFEIHQANESDSEVIKVLLTENGQRPTIIINSSSIYFFAKTEGKIIGVIGAEIEVPSALIRSTAVLQPWRNKGLAADLVKQFLKNLKVKKSLMFIFLAEIRDGIGKNLDLVNARLGRC